MSAWADGKAWLSGLIITAYSERGRDKAECQDKILVGDTILSEGFYETWRSGYPLVVAVSDGVGGNPAGEKAAMMAVEGVRCLNRMDNCNEDTIREVICLANQGILQVSAEDPSCENMAATLTGIYFYVNRDTIFHSGNTRIMTYASGMMVDLTTDHTGEEETEDGETCLVNTGGVGNGYEAFLDDSLEVRRGELYLDTGALLLLTSDGIHDYVDREEMGGLFPDMPYQPGWEKEFCLRLAKMAREGGSVDDISIVLLYEEVRGGSADGQDG